MFDIGNTHVNGAIFEGRRIVTRFVAATGDCMNSRSVSRFITKNVGRKSAAKIEGVCISSVVPAVNRPFRDACIYLFKKTPLFVTAKNAGVILRQYKPQEIGTDRIVNALAAYRKYKKAVIVVDIGTGTTIDAVNSKGEFLGGAIAPGVSLCAVALHEMTAKLPRVLVSRPKRVIGSNTRDCIRSGLFFGCAGLIDNLVREISREMKCKPLVIATGGDAKLISKGSKTIDRVDPNLTLEGLKFIWERKRIKAIIWAA